MKKKGISIVTTTLILVAISISVIIIVFFSLGKFRSSLFFYGDKEKNCASLDFSPFDVCYENITVLTDSGDIKEERRIQFKIRSNIEEQNISGFLVSLEDNLGNIKVVPTLFNQDISGFTIKTFYTNPLDKGFQFKRVGITPQIKLSNVISLCDKKKVLIEENQVGSIC
ncbi:hypothetical protein GYA25_01760 [Candidatus Woesearchaeota archaeon]|nr:hypothetical protein [Candidatus Woesearchaeota archaeon]